MRKCLVVLALASAALAQQQPADSPHKLDPTREKALSNALKGFKFRKSTPVRPRQMEIAEDRKCSIPLHVLPADPDLDRRMVHSAPKETRMPMPTGLPSCDSIK